LVNLRARSGGSTNAPPSCSCNLRASTSLRCLVVDDNARFRNELSGLLEEQGIEVAGGAGSGDEAVQQVARLHPDVALVDIDLGGESGFDVARRLREARGDAVPDVILISTHDEREFADLIEESPVAGFISKTELTAAAIQRILAAGEN
jgi:DNA-binding NarL/FixJ family response regulator